MYHNNNINLTPGILKGVIWSVAGIILIIVAMAFIRPWYNVWSQEMEGKAEFAKAEQNRKIKIEEAKANLEAENSTRRLRSNAPKVQPKPSASKTEALPQPISSICGYANSQTSATRLSSISRPKLIFLSWNPPAP